MNRKLHRIAGAALVSLALTAAFAGAQSFGGSDGYQPLVPVSKFARPAGWLDPSRLRIATSLSVGTGFTGGSSALQVTSFSYQFTRPAWLQVGLGNSFGGGNPRGNGVFLESLSFGFRPSANSVFQVQFRDVRSPLQYSHEPFGLNRW
ncbi:MAG: hypothetical protein ABIS67_08965 [Candidatus Eisenbacteria bacterium]